MTSYVMQDFYHLVTVVQGSEGDPGPQGSEGPRGETVSPLSLSPLPLITQYH